MPTPSGSTTSEIGISGGGNITRYFPFPLTPTLISPYWPTVVKNSPGLRQKATIRR
ncbi:hypothetical protein HZM71_004174 [Salmonella enterica]|nr:hypothetical protein [Salmonella enterica]EFR2129311.1 hypothetical protein [Salmonella enterica]EHD3206316.1 hypothetical protein [Salmonella enterica subsp. houtenae serovar 50:g,z51:-]EHH3584947.1 hypothetical protein [Salmonella enterica]